MVRRRWRTDAAVAVLAVIYAYGMIPQVAFLMGIMAPAIAMLITFAVFVRYWFEVREFSKQHVRQ